MNEIATSLVSLLNDLGYFGIFFIMAIESTAFPIVIPSEFFLISYGISVYNGNMNFLLVFLCANVGIVTGAVLNYYISAYLGRAFLYKYGKYILLKKEVIVKWENVFLKYSKFLVFTGRFIPIPVVKHIVSIPAGLSRMDIRVFTGLTALGGAIFSAFVIGLGYWFGRKISDDIESVSLFVTKMLYVIIIIGVAGFVIKKIVHLFSKNK